MSDLIDRQMAIVQVKKDVWDQVVVRTVTRVLKELPSAQPEIIRCKDCAIRYDSCPMVVRSVAYIRFFTEDDDFCSRGKRKEIDHG